MSNDNSNFFKSDTFKGVLALLITTLVVVLIVIVFVYVILDSKSDSTEIQSTGRVTITEPKAVTNTTTKRTTKKPVKKTSREYKNYDEMEVDIDIDTDEYKNQTVISAVYLHPEPNSSSENLCVIPAGAVCKVYADENGWLYLDYEGQKGYAWHEFFSE